MQAQMGKLGAEANPSPPPVSEFVIEQIEPPSAGGAAANTSNVGQVIQPDMSVDEEVILARLMAKQTEVRAAVEARDGWDRVYISLLSSGEQGRGVATLCVQRCWLVRVPKSVPCST